MKTTIKIKCKSYTDFNTEVVVVSYYLTFNEIESKNKFSDIGE